MTEAELLLIQMSGEPKFEATLMGKNEIYITTIDFRDRIKNVMRCISVGTRMLIGDPFGLYVEVVVASTSMKTDAKGLMAHFIVELVEPLDWDQILCGWNPLWILREGREESRDD